MNPFTPTFGATPPLLVGRSTDIEDFREGLLQGPGAPERATLVVGLRGTGKTVMLNAYEDVAKQLGWRVISESTTPGLLSRLVTEHLPRLLAEEDPRQTDSRITSLSGGGLSATRQVTERHTIEPGLRTQLEDLARLLDQRGNGVLITVDEVHRNEIADLRELGSVIQHCIREDLPVAFAGAGLPSSVSDLLSDKVSTFLRRADKRIMGAVLPDDVAAAIEVPILDNGRQITPKALAIAVRGTGGYPFMIQLVGLHTWRSSGDATVIDEAHAERGVAQARRKVGDLVHASALADLSATDRSFLAAMAVDDVGPSKMGDIAERLGVDPTYAGQYRLRLLDAEMIRTSGYGRVEFTLPGLREYLRNHAATSTWDPAEYENWTPSQGASNERSEPPRTNPPGQGIPR